MQTLFSTLILATMFVCISASAEEGNVVLTECSGKGSHVEMRACLQTNADASARKLLDAEDKMRRSLAALDEEPEYIKRSSAAFESSVRQFSRFRAQHCEFIASLAAGGNGQSDLRLSCIYELNEKRIAQIRQAQAFKLKTAVE